MPNEGTEIVFPGSWRDIHQEISAGFPKLENQNKISYRNLFEPVSISNKSL